MRLSTTTSTTPQPVDQEDDQENVVETSVEKERPRIPFPPRGNLRSRFRPNRVRLPFRRPGRVREEENKADIEEMIKTLDMEDELKQEFNRFVADKLGASTRPKFKPSLTGLRDRAKIRNSFLRTRFKNTNTTPAAQ